MLQKKSFSLCSLIFAIVLLFAVTSCTDNPGSRPTEGCFDGLTDSQQVIIKKMIALLKDSSKITQKTAIGFSASFTDKDSISDFSNANTLSKYTMGYLSDFFRILDLQEFPVADADRFYGKYVAEKCAAMETAYSTEYGHETKSVLVSSDSLYNLVNALHIYQGQTGRKTGVRVVFASYDDRMIGGVKKSGELTYFMVGTIDTLATPLSTFSYRVQKDLTILGSSWGIPVWGLSAYNHGDLCPQQCDLTGKNTKYYH